MNTKRLNINKILLGALIFVVSLPAADKSDLKNNEQQNRASATEAIPLGYVAPKQPAEGIKFATPTKQASRQKLSVLKNVDIASNNNTSSQRVDDGVIELIINKYMQGEFLNQYEKQILRNNINEIPPSGDEAFRPSITERSTVSRNASDLFFSEYSEGSSNNKYLVNTFNTI